MYLDWGEWRRSLWNSWWPYHCSGLLLIAAGKQFPPRSILVFPWKPLRFLSAVLRLSVDCISLIATSYPRLSLPKQTEGKLVVEITLFDYKTDFRLKPFREMGTLPREYQKCRLACNTPLTLFVLTLQCGESAEIWGYTCYRSLAISAFLLFFLLSSIGCRSWIFFVLLG